MQPLIQTTRLNEITVHMKKGFVVAGILLVCLTSGSVGYELAAREFERAIGEQELVNLDRQLAVRAYIDKENSEGAKGMLDINMDRHLTRIREYFRPIDIQQRTYEQRVLGRLQQLWKTHPPFRENEFASLQNDEDWIAVRRKNDQFLNQVSQRKD